MNTLPYYRAFPRDFFGGTVGMDLETKGAYRILLDLIYMHGGALPDDARFIAGHLGCSVRRWNSIRDKLVSLGKIRAENEIISNFRADKELEISRKLQEKNRENRAGRNENNDLPKIWSKDTDTYIKKDTSLRSVSQKERASEADFDHGFSEPAAEPPPDPVPALDLIPADPPPPDPVHRVFDHFAAVAGRVGWPRPKLLDAARQKKITARLRDLGGPEGGTLAFFEMIDRAAESDFLTGRGPENRWRPSLDWFLEPKNITKIQEGNFDNRHENGGDGAFGGPRAERGRTGGVARIFAGFAAAADPRPG